MEVLNELTLTVIEWSSVFLNVAFTVLIAYELRWGWLCGFAGSALAIVLYAAQSIWALTVLQGFFAIAGIYGFWSWGSADDKPISQVGFKKHATVIVLCGMLTLITAYTLMNHLDGNYPIMDAFISVFSVGATVLMAWKWIGHWIYWMVIDSVWLVLNLKLEYYPFAALSTMYLVLSVFGWFKWKRELDGYQPAID